MLFLESLDYLIYSSHKTATQSLNAILSTNNFRSRHCHYIHNLQIKSENRIKTYQELKQKFIDDLELYKKAYNKKIKVISVIRDPAERLPSSFFQTYHTDEIYFFNKKENETTIMQKSINELIDIFESDIKIGRFRGSIESLREMSHIFQTDIISNLKKTESQYYFENELVSVFVLDFNKVISNNNLAYISQCLNLNLTKNAKSNLSSEKIYYDKYIEFKKELNIMPIIESNYENFYFEAFKNVL